ncbi:DUF1707 domain-containing protein [Nocardia sp. NPDC049526]|uniref:DUF1707 domain-containing protein n=1 Tax=Nocardia sp. NPDC049526 TaxID=3364316 RepID=UPI003795EFD7
MTDAPENLPAVRVGDIDREVAAKQLQLAVDEGQLDLLELDKRLVAVYSAQTAQELVAITADLPVIAAAREPIELRTGSGARVKPARGSSRPRSRPNAAPAASKSTSRRHFAHTARSWSMSPWVPAQSS